MNSIARFGHIHFGNMLVLLMAMTLYLLLPNMAQAQVVWEDYQGTNGILGSSNQDKPGPTYVNNNSPNNINNLRAISADISNATRTGTSATIDYPSTSGTLCNTSSGSGVDFAGTSEACTTDAQGRVVYALVKFPTSGNYSFSASHDDEIDLDLSSDYTNLNYRQASYDIPAGNAANFTGETTFETLAGVFSSPDNNACILLRIYWNNAGGRNFLRLQWTKPGNITEIIPASQILTPGVAANVSTCTGTVSTTATSIGLNKIVGSTGRAGATDQFRISIQNNAQTSTLASATTAGTGTGQQVSTGAVQVSANTDYKITEVMASGSTYPIAAYTPTLSCTRAGSPYTPTGAAPTWTVRATATGQQIICNITNTRRSATLQLRKTWVDARVNDAVTLPATTGFTNNTVALASVANSANETDTGSSVSVLVGDNGTLAGEIFDVGTAAQYGATLACSGGALSGTNAKVANSLRVTETTAGTTIVCTYSNMFLSPLILTKTSAPYSDPVNGLANPKMVPGAMIAYTITVSSPTTYTVTSNSMVIIDTLPANARLFVSDLQGAGSGPVQFIEGTPASGLSYSFTSLASTTDDVDFSNDNGATWTYVPTPNANGVDNGVTSIRVHPKGIMASNANFRIILRCNIQ